MGALLDALARELAACARAVADAEGVAGGAHALASRSACAACCFNHFFRVGALHYRVVVTRDDARKLAPVMAELAGMCSCGSMGVKDLRTTDAVIRRSAFPRCRPHGRTDAVNVTAAPRLPEHSALVGDAALGSEVSGAHRLSRGLPTIPIPASSSAGARNARRLVWGSYFPLPAHWRTRCPDAGHLFSTFPRWCPTRATRRRILSRQSGAAFMIFRSEAT